MCKNAAIVRGYFEGIFKSITRITLNCIFSGKYIHPPLHFIQCKKSRLWKITSAEIVSRWVYRYCKTIALMCPWSFFAERCYADLLPPGYVENWKDTTIKTHVITYAHINTRTYRETDRQIHLCRRDESSSIPVPTVTQPGHVNKTRKLKT